MAFPTCPNLAHILLRSSQCGGNFGCIMIRRPFGPEIEVYSRWCSVDRGLRCLHRWAVQPKETLFLGLNGFVGSALAASLAANVPGIRFLFSDSFFSSCGLLTRHDRRTFRNHRLSLQAFLSSSALSSRFQLSLTHGFPPCGGPLASCFRSGPPGLL